MMKLKLKLIPKKAKSQKRNHFSYFSLHIDNLVCSLRGYTRLGHVMCYAVIFSKTLRVNRLFNSSLRETMNPTFVSTRSHLAIISFIVGFTLTYSTVWGFLR